MAAVSAPSDGVKRLLVAFEKDVKGPLIQWPFRVALRMVFM